MDKILHHPSGCLGFLPSTVPFTGSVWTGVSQDLDPLSLTHTETEVKGLASNPHKILLEDVDWKTRGKLTKQMHLYKEQLRNKHVSFHTWMAGKSRKRYDWKTIGLVYFLGSLTAKPLILQLPKKGCFQK